VLYPVVANLDCNYCQKYRHDEHGVPQFDHRTGLIEERFCGQPKNHPQGCVCACPPQCVRHKNNPQMEHPCPKGTPESQNTLTPEMEDCYQFYRECKAVGSFPDDAWVRFIASRIAAVEKSIDEEIESGRHQLVIEALLRRKYV